MIARFLTDKIPELVEIETERKDRLIEYFSKAPLWLLDSIRVEQFDKEVTFIREGETVNNIYILLTGIAEAIDLRIYGVPFNYREFKDVYAFGSMEVILDEDVYRSTLRTVTKCTLVRMTRADFEKWLELDAEILKREAKLIVKDLLEEGRNDRLLIFAQGSDRLALLLLKQYEYYKDNGILTMRYSRQRIADATGVCEKTVSRAIKTFAEQGIITKESSTITINKRQYEELKKNVTQFVEL